MSLTKIDQEGTFPSLTPLLEDFFGKDMMGRTGWKHASSMPAVNIEEKPHAFEITVAAPGLQREDFVIELENGVLTVSAKKSEKTEEKNEKGKYTRREFSYHAFSRSFTLPKVVAADQIEANYADGILAIQLPKKAHDKAQPVKRIAIK